MDGTTALSLVTPAVAALAGIWIGSRLSYRHERDAWLRNERLRAYADLADALDGFEWAVVDSDTRDPSRVFSAYRNAQRAANRVWIVGGDQAWEQSVDSMGQLTNLLDAFDPQTPPAEYERLLEEWWDEDAVVDPTSDFLDAAALDLGVMRVRRRRRPRVVRRRVT